MSGLRVSILQYDTIDGEPERNVDRALALLASAADADLYLLPELWTTGYAHAGWDRVAREVTPRVCERLQRESVKRGAWIGGSQISLNARGRLVNRFWIFGPRGEATHYDKGHLFAPMAEPEHLAAGDGRVTLKLGGMTAALSICFDLRFPEMSRLDALDGAELFLVTSAWPESRADVLRVLARARAIENQAYLVLCNRTGAGVDGTRFGGGSMAVAPDGHILADAGTEPRTIAVTLERSLVEQTRASGSMLALRRPGLDWVGAPEPPKRVRVG